MPYISSERTRREQLRNGEPALTAGELNYQIFYYVKHKYYKTSEIENFIKQFLGTNPNYQKYNDMTGCLIRCYKEIKRRLDLDLKKTFERFMESYDNEIAKYEDKKIIENGDVE